ncbi:hypothetical protein SH2C18_33720 [Clostridium sediminicola]|uniref:hypothetical protein n=1 Tax=Clostridium sediminicola TaxID=3114879 RepID=UPI0031F24271
MKNGLDPLKEFLSRNGVNIGNNHSEQVVINDETFENQLMLIVKFHDSCRGYIPKMWNKIPDKRGSLIQQFKNKQKIAYQYISELKGEKKKSTFEEFLLDNISGFFAKTQNLYYIAQHEKYNNLLKRCMEREEICIGNSCFSNLWQNKGIHYGTLNRCCLDMYENDVFFLISRTKIKGSVLNWEKLINIYCKEEKLDHFSEEYIKCLLDYPYDYIKYAIKYFTNKKFYNESISWEKEKKYMNKIKIEMKST